MHGVGPGLETAAQATDAPTPRGRTVRSERITRVEYLVCSTIVLFGAAIRIPGLTSGDIWEDDAWITLPVRVGLREALRMDVSTPLFVLLLRQWASIDVTATNFVQLLPLATSLLAIASVWWLVRTIGGRMWTRALVTTLVAINPIFIVYSTRIKEYSFEVLLGTLLLVCLAKSIQRPTPWRSMLLLGVSVIACFSSGALVLFVGGVLVAFVIQGLRTRRAKDRYWIVTIIGTCISMLTSYIIFYDHIPPRLQQFWAPYEFSHLNAAPLTHTTGLIGNGIAHGLLGVPIQVGPFPYTYQLTAVGFAVAFATAVVVFIAFLGLTAGALWLTRSEVSPAGTATLASTSILVIALLAAVTGHAPLGGGRTDLWWYPAVWCIVAVVIEASFLRFAPLLHHLKESHRRAVVFTSALLVVAIAVPYGIYYRSWYPAQDLRALFSQNQAEIRPTDWIYLSTYNSWTWAVEGLGPFHILFDSGNVHTGKGWTVSVDKFNVQQIIGSDPASICSRSRRVWWIGVNYSENNPSNYRLSGVVGNTINAEQSVFTHFLSYGWHESQVIVGRGVNAILYTHPEPC